MLELINISKHYSHRTSVVDISAFTEPQLRYQKVLVFIHITCKLLYW